VETKASASRSLEELASLGGYSKTYRREKTKPKVNPKGKNKSLIGCQKVILKTAEEKKTSRTTRNHKKLEEKVGGLDPA